MRTTSMRDNERKKGNEAKILHTMVDLALSSCTVTAVATWYELARTAADQVVLHYTLQLYSELCLCRS